MLTAEVNIRLRELVLAVSQLPFAELVVAQIIGIEILCRGAMGTAPAPLAVAQIVKIRGSRCLGLAGAPVLARIGRAGVDAIPVVEVTLCVVALVVAVAVALHCCSAAYRTGRRGGRWRWRRRGRRRWNEAVQSVEITVLHGAGGVVAHSVVHCSGRACRVALVVRLILQAVPDLTVVLGVGALDDQHKPTALCVYVATEAGTGAGCPVRVPETSERGTGHVAAIGRSAQGIESQAVGGWPGPAFHCTVKVRGRGEISKQSQMLACRDVDRAAGTVTGAGEATIRTAG